jgi:putative transposase
MRRIDELHLNYPFAGARMLAKLLKRMGIHALYRNPNTSKRHTRSILTCCVT